MNTPARPHCIVRLGRRRFIARYAGDIPFQTRLRRANTVQNIHVLLRQWKNICDVRDIDILFK